MYIKLEEITYIHPSKYRPLAGDRVTYERKLNGDRIFTITGEASKHDAAPVKVAGLFYIDTNDRPCLVPEIWNDDDAWCARSFEPAAGFPDDAPRGDLAHYLSARGFAIVDGAVADGN